MKVISILGSTGSIGTQSLDVVRQHPEDFSVAALVTRQNIDLLEKQIEEFQPPYAGVVDEGAYRVLSGRYQGPTKLVGGKEALIMGATVSEAELVITAVVGAAGIEPTIAAIKAGKTIGLANKETLVAGGPLITELCAQYGVDLLPIDSEHSAIFQCLAARPRETVDRLIITASGGPLRTWPKEDLGKATPADCLKHPNWSMGNKITIDSATLFNKGLEVIEAHWLFGFDFDHIDVVVHKQSLVHSMIQCRDGAIIAQMGTADMREPIQYALTHPNRLPLDGKKLSFTETLCLDFEPPRWDDFPALRLAFEVGRKGGFAPAIFNAANEEAVYAFLDGRIGFNAIYETVEAVLSQADLSGRFTLDNLLAKDGWARKKARELMA